MDTMQQSLLKMEAAKADEILSSFTQRSWPPQSEKSY
jgi:hypothetical protein